MSWWSHHMTSQNEMNFVLFVQRLKSRDQKWKVQMLKISLATVLPVLKFKSNRKYKNVWYTRNVWNKRSNVSSESGFLGNWVSFFLAFQHPYSEKVSLISALHSQNDNRFIQVTWNSGEKSRFPYIFLRENCKCPNCFHPIVKQRLVIADKETSVIDSIAIQEDEVKADGNTSLLKDGCELVTKNHKLSERAYEYEAIMTDDKSLLQWCYDLNSCGLTLIQNAPAREGVLFQLAKRIGHYKPTLHGYDYQVNSFGLIVSLLDRPKPAFL